MVASWRVLEVAVFMDKKKYDLKYISATKPHEVALNGKKIYSALAKDIRSYAWEYELQFRGIQAPLQKARGISLEAEVKDLSELDTLRRIANADIKQGAAGIFEAHDGWQQHGYIVGMALGELYPTQKADVKLEAVLIDGCWRKKHTKQFIAQAAQPSKTGKDYPHAYPFDYAAQEPFAQTLDFGQSDEISFRLTMYGPASDPCVIIGDNRYQLKTSITAGDFVVVDSLAKTIELHTRAGSTLNIFDKAERGRGRGAGSYIFEPIKQGEQKVRWDGSFDFTLEYFEEESIPPWTHH